MQTPTTRSLSLVLCLGLACGDDQGASAGALADTIPFTQTSDAPPTSGDPTAGTDSASASDEDSGSGDGSAGQDQCGGCPFTRPNILFVLDYSATMNREWDGGVSRYDHVRSALVEFLTVEVDLAQRMNFALMHYGHDPDPATMGTTIEVDASGLVDGQKLDFPWDVGGVYVPCQNDELASGIIGIIPPAFGMTIGIGTWTRGALDFAHALIRQQRLDHGEPIDGDPYYRIVLLTDGQWTNVLGNMTLMPPEDDPVIPALALSAEFVKTYVLAVGEAADASFIHDLALAGGTDAAFAAFTSDQLGDQLRAVFAAIEAEPGITPEECHG